MSIIDIILAVIILIGAYEGYKDGFIVSVFSLFAIILGLLCGFKLMGIAMVFLGSNYNVDEKILPYLAFGAVFVLVVIVVSMLGKLIKASIDKSILGPADQGVGALLGVIKATFMLSIGLWIVDSLKIELPERLTSNSWLQPMVSSAAPKIANWLGEFLPIFDDVF